MRRELTLACALLLGGRAAAMPSSEVTNQPVGPTSVAQLLHDLDGRNAGDRHYAARELRRRALSLNRRRQGASLSAEEAAVAWADLRMDVEGSLIRCIEREEERVSCADAAKALDLSATLPALRAARDSEQRRRALRTLDQTIQSLEALP